MFSLLLALGQFQMDLNGSQNDLASHTSPYLLLLMVTKYPSTQYLAIIKLLIMHCAFFAMEW